MVGSAGIKRDCLLAAADLRNEPNQPRDEGGVLTGVVCCIGILECVGIGVDAGGCIDSMGDVTVGDGEGVVIC